MDRKGKKPDVDAILNGLKDFQRNTVEYVFKRLYKENDRTNRFLIADEVGLGKTLVARGVIAKAVEELWNTVGRIDIIYICSNVDIARQNINRINITDQRDLSFASRMTLLPARLNNFDYNKINFISFTPGTSFNLRSQGGLAYERVLIYNMFREGLNLGDKAVYKNIFQAYVTNKRGWRSQLKQFDHDQIDQEIQKIFIKRIKNDTRIMHDFEELSQRFYHYRKHVPYSDRSKQINFIGRVRQVLAEICINKLEPDIIIMDEFQRFKDLLDGDDEVAELAQKLFNYKNEESDTKIILLSATPYKMYTMYHEHEDDHYEDFFRTVFFLNQSHEETEEIRVAIKNYRDEIIRYRSNSNNTINEARKNVQSKLKKYIVRTERLAVTSDRNGMVFESADDIGMLTTHDLHEFTMIDKVGDIVETRDIVEYWKSSPYILNVMDKSAYKVKSNLINYLNTNASHDKLAKIIETYKDYLLSWHDIQQYKKLDPQNSKLRTLMKNTIGKTLFNLLWIPPSLPYYSVNTGPFTAEYTSDVTKSLLFSSWQVVPKVVAQVCSYEAERRNKSNSDHKYSYDEERSENRQLLNFSITNGEYSGLSNFTLMYPCLSIAVLCDPLSEGIQFSNQTGIGTYEAIFKLVKEKITNTLAPLLEKYEHGSHRVSQRWYWLSMVLLDRQFYCELYKKWLNSDDDTHEWRGMITGRGEEEKEGAFSEHIDVLQMYFNFNGSKDPFLQLGPPPEDLYDVVTEIAIGSPAIVSLRSLLRHCKNKDVSGYSSYLLTSSARCAVSFRIMFNLPYSINTIQKFSTEHYWRAVLQYCNNGNLQAVMDEYTHILRESLGLIDTQEPDLLHSMAKEIETALSLRTVNLSYDHFDVDSNNKTVEHSSHRLRCRFALSFGYSESDDGTKTRPDQVRRAFNSPFQPFILATTSIGQEGLDFHHYCHDVYHWNLPSNPVDMEQREGRVHRYKGHAVRRNCAAQVPINLLKGNVEELDDPWRYIFTLCKKQRSPGSNDLVPFWLNESKDTLPEHRICRHVPSLPMSRENLRLENLKKDIVAYRMVFGQPRQEDLVNYLRKFYEEEAIDPEELLQYRIDLSP